jgi:hypothetical protein
VLRHHHRGADRQGAGGIAREARRAELGRGRSDAFLAERRGGLGPARFDPDEPDISGLSVALQGAAHLSANPLDGASRKLRVVFARNLVQPDEPVAEDSVSPKDADEREGAG